LSTTAEEGVAIVQRAVEAWNEQGLDAFVKLLHPEVEWRPDPDWPESQTYRGRDEVRAFLDQFADAWEHVIIEVDELLEAGDLVVMRFRWLLRGRSSGVEQELPVSGVVAAHDGLVSSGHFFLDHDEALRDAGIETEA
jgi:ketosteroid isomerase-like protein